MNGALDRLLGAARRAARKAFRSLVEISTGEPRLADDPPVSSPCLSGRCPARSRRAKRRPRRGSRRRPPHQTLHRSDNLSWFPAPWRQRSSSPPAPARTRDMAKPRDRGSKPRPRHGRVGRLARRGRKSPRRNWVWPNRMRTAERKSLAGCGSVFFHIISPARELQQVCLYRFSDSCVCAQLPRRNFRIAKRELLLMRACRRKTKSPSLQCCRRLPFLLRSQHATASGARRSLQRFTRLHGLHQEGRVVDRFLAVARHLHATQLAR